MRTTILLLALWTYPLHANDGKLPSSHRGKKFTAVCLTLLASHAGVAWWVADDVARKLTPVLPAEKLTPFSVPLDDDRFAITAATQVYALQGGHVVNSAGHRLPDSQSTRSIAAFRGLLLRLDTFGKLWGYQPKIEQWAQLDSPEFTHLAAFDAGILGITQAGELFILREVSGRRVRIEGNQIQVGGENLTFEHLGGRYRKFGSTAYPGALGAGQVYAFGEDVLEFNAGGADPILFKAGTAEREKLRDLEAQYREEEAPAEKQAD